MSTNTFCFASFLNLNSTFFSLLKKASTICFEVRIPWKKTDNFWWLSLIFNVEPAEAQNVSLWKIVQILIVDVAE